MNPAPCAGGIGYGRLPPRDSKETGVAPGNGWNLAVVAALVLLLNLPFGAWRAGVRKFSVAWFVAVHAPVPLVAGLRILSGLGFQWSTFPVIVAAYFAGQSLGGWWRMRTCPPR